MAGDVQLVNLRFQDMVSALSARSVDAAAAVDPFLSSAEQSGTGTVVTDFCRAGPVPLIFAASLALGDQADRGTDLAGRAVAALESAVNDEGLLQGMQGASPRQAFDGGDLRAILHHRECQAGIDPPSADKDCAGAALAVVTALLGPGEIEVQAQGIDQSGP